MRGTPVAPEIGSKPSDLPAPDCAKRVDNPSWVSPRTLMPQVVALCQTEKLATPRATENNTSGGSRDTELNEHTVIPLRKPSGAQGGTTRTPRGKNPSAFRNSPDVKVMNRRPRNTGNDKVHSAAGLSASPIS